jgi:hypothetical protein
MYPQHPTAYAIESYENMSIMVDTIAILERDLPYMYQGR